MCSTRPWTNQGCQMDTRIYGTSHQYNPSAFGMWDSVMLIPVFDRWIFPALGRRLGRPDGPSDLQKMGTGLVFMVICMISAGIV